MPLPNVFESSVSAKLIERINQLKPDTQPQWGTMSTDQMLAHCNVVYEMAFTEKHKKPNALMRFLLKSFLKPIVTGEKPYKKNSRTAPQFVIADKRNFDTEKQNLIGYIQKTQSLGMNYFEGKESPSFGKLTAQEWNNLFYKHLDHHLGQFGV